MRRRSIFNLLLWTILLVPCFGYAQVDDVLEVQLSEPIEMTNGQSLRVVKLHKEGNRIIRDSLLPIALERILSPRANESLSLQAVSFYADGALITDHLMVELNDTELALILGDLLKHLFNEPEKFYARAMLLKKLIPGLDERLKIFESDIKAHYLDFGLGKPYKFRTIRELIIAEYLAEIAVENNIINSVEASLNKTFLWITLNIEDELVEFRRLLRQRFKLSSTPNSKKKEVIANLIESASKAISMDRLDTPFFNFLRNQADQLELPNGKKMKFWHRSFYKIAYKKEEAAFFLTAFWGIGVGGLLPLNFEFIEGIGVFHRVLFHMAMAGVGVYLFQLFPTYYHWQRYSPRRVRRAARALGCAQSFQ